MYESLLSEKVITESKNGKHFLKILILRCGKPLEVSGYGMFKMCNQHFKDVSFEIFF